MPDNAAGVETVDLILPRPVDYRRSDPTGLIDARRRRLPAARQHRKGANLRLQQRMLPR